MNLRYFWPLIFWNFAIFAALHKFAFGLELGQSALWAAGLYRPLYRAVFGRVELASSNSRLDWLFPRHLVACAFVELLGRLFLGPVCPTGARILIEQKNY